MKHGGRASLLAPISFARKSRARLCACLHPSLHRRAALAVGFVLAVLGALVAVGVAVHRAETEAAHEAFIDYARSLTRSFLANLEYERNGASTLSARSEVAASNRRPAPATHPRALPTRGKGKETMTNGWNVWVDSGAVRGPGGAAKRGGGEREKSESGSRAVGNHRDLGHVPGRARPPRGGALGRNCVWQVSGVGLEGRRCGAARRPGLFGLRRVRVDRGTMLVVRPAASALRGCVGGPTTRVNACEDANPSENEGVLRAVTRGGSEAGLPSRWWTAGGCDVPPLRTDSTSGVRLRASEARRRVQMHSSL